MNPMQVGLGVTVASITNHNSNLAHVENAMWLSRVRGFRSARRPG